ncbi:MAG: signal peptidase I [Firmicutes bacterium]|nr:signal peptidase I [Bacillota bacterium]
MKILKEIIPYVIIIVVVILIRTFIVTPVQVDGESMYPTLDNDEILILKKYDKTYERFDIIVFNYNGSKLVKRVIGLPGEKVAYKNNELYINDKKINDVITIGTTNFAYDKIPDGCYFVLGDNRGNSIDSRRIGVICNKDILGTTTFSIFPFNKFGFID